MSEIQSQQQELVQAKQRYRGLLAGLDVITAAQVTEGDLLPQLIIDVENDSLGE